MQKIKELICYLKDHHRPEILFLKQALCLIRREDDTYPFNELSGCGIGFKLIQAYAQRHNMPFETIEVYLDLVAVGTAADIVPIVGENRVLVYHGLQWLNKNPRPGIKAILDLAQVKRELTVNDIVLSSVRESMLQAEFRMPDRQLICWSQRIPLRHCSKAKISMRKMLKDEISTWISPSTPFVSFRKIHFSPKENQQYSFIRNGTKVLLESLLPDWPRNIIGPLLFSLNPMDLPPVRLRSVKDFDIYNAIESCSDLFWAVWRTHVCRRTYSKAGKSRKIFWTFWRNRCGYNWWKNHSW